MRHYRRHQSNVPDNAFTHTVAVLGAIAALVSLAAFGVVAVVVVVGAVYGLIAL